MNVLKALIAVMTMQVATILKEVTTALATMDTQAMGFPAQVCKFIPFENFHLQRFTFQILMSASVTMEVVTTTVITQMEVTYVPAIMATGLTMMDTLVKVDKILLCASSMFCYLQSGCFGKKG